MTHHQDGAVGTGQAIAVPGQQRRRKAAGLLHQFADGAIEAPIGAFEGEGFRGLAPAALLLGIALSELVAEQATPGRQINFQELVTGGGHQTLTLGRQQSGGGAGGAAQRGSVGGVKREIAQGFTRDPGLELPLGGEHGEVVAALDAVLDVETALPVTDQHNPKGHGTGAAAVIVWEWRIGPCAWPRRAAA